MHCAPADHFISSAARGGGSADIVLEDALAPVGAGKAVQRVDIGTGGRIEAGKKAVLAAVAPVISYPHSQP